MLSYAIEYQKIDAVNEENFFFSNFTRVPFPKETLRKFDKNFIEFSFIDLRLFPLSHR